MASESKAAVWIGWFLTVLSAASFLMGGAMKVFPPEGMPQQPDLGWRPEYLFRLGMVEIACALIYLFPRTSVLGAILLTGYLGGAVATNARTGDLMMFAPVGVGVFTWLGLYLRDARIRALVPFRSS